MSLSLYIGSALTWVRVEGRLDNKTWGYYRYQLQTDKAVWEQFMKAAQAVEFKDLPLEPIGPDKQVR